MLNQFARTELLLGEEGMRILKQSRVAVFGVGGVGGYVCEALARTGVGSFDLIDNDRVSLSNLNRQIIALHSTVGQLKVDVMKARILDINPEAQVRVYPCFYLPENADEFPLQECDYIVDAVDTVAAKLELAQRAYRMQIPIISSMGTGNKLTPNAFRVADINKTSVCPLARVLRKELRSREVPKLKVVYSEEDAMTPNSAALLAETENPGSRRRSVPGSVAFVPSSAGLLIASEVIKDLISKKGEEHGAEK